MKMTNTLARIPNEVRIVRSEDHLRFLTLFLEWDVPGDQCCPHCGGTDFIRKGTSDVKTYSHIAVGGRPTLLSFTFQRFRCWCCRRGFTEEPYWLHPSIHVSMALYLNMCSGLQTTASIRHVAEDNGISDGTVCAILDSIHFGVPTCLPVTFGIDEFKGSAGT